MSKYKQQKISNLSKLSQYVTQKNGTEPPFVNEYWNNKAEGIYLDIVSGEPLFSSVDKYDSGTGWPSFTAPIEGVDLIEKADHNLISKRIEVRSSEADSHLGHIFSDGPTNQAGSGSATPTGRRYCLNSAALRFVPIDEMEGEGYGEYLKLFN